MPTIQWYPGHIAKHERKLTEMLKLVDVVVEVLDARIPLASTNPRLERKIRVKPTLMVLNKSDLGDPRQNKLWKVRLNEDAEHTAMLYESKSSQGKAQLIQQIITLGEVAMKRMEARGRKRRPIRVLIAGMPNVGKSSLINNIVGRKKVQTGHKAGVTRHNQWVRIHPAVELLDSPGIIPPQLDSDEAGILLAIVNSIGEAAFEEEPVSRFLMERIDQLYPGLLHTYFKLDAEIPMTLESVAEKRHYKLGGNQLDPLRAAQALLSEFRHGRIGRISLEHAGTSEPRPPEKLKEIFFEEPGAEDFGEDKRPEEPDQAHKEPS